MADDITVTPGTGVTIAADDVGGKLYQRVKLAHGADGSATDVSVAAPLPVEDANSDAALAALQAIEAAVEGTQTISGAVTVSGGATAANQAALLAAVDGVEAALAGTLAVSGPLTDAQLRAAALPVSATSLPLPSGAATSAKQDTGNAALSTLAGAVAGAEMQVDVLTLPALPAGTNAIGKLAANSGVDIGDVDVTSLPSLPAGTNNIGDVDIASIAAGENLIGLVGAPDIVVTVTPTLDTNAYTAGDLLFDSTEIANAVRANGGTAILQSITIIDKDDQKLGATLLFADANTDLGTPNSAPDPDDTEAATVIGHVAVAASDYVDLGGASVACIRGVGLLLKAGAATTSLYVAAITGGTPTHTASGLVLKIGLLRS